jgi:predicted enzyme related to lactoylglutathione lyase
MSFRVRQRFIFCRRPLTGLQANLEGDCIMDYKLELVLLPVSDVDRAKAFYLEQAGFDLLVDTGVNGVGRVVQVTPPGSSCSIGFGTGITDATPGSARGTHLIVTDIEAARKELLERSVAVSEVRHLDAGGWVAGPHPERGDYQSFADFSDPDGNSFVLQEVGRPTRDA